MLELNGGHLTFHYLSLTLHHITCCPTVFVIDLTRARTVHKNSPLEQRPAVAFHPKSHIPNHTRLLYSIGPDSLSVITLLLMN